jgi:hypothetical protein
VKAAGGCVCGALRYALAAPPLFTHVCHCRDCQRRTGTAFAMTTIVLRDDLTITDGAVVATPTSPRSTQHLCSACATVVYVASSVYPVTLTLRPGTLDDPSVATPQAHIWVCRRQPWVILASNVPQFETEYDPRIVWPATSLARLDAALRSQTRADAGRAREPPR